MNTSEPERFWSKVDVGGPDECWEWLANTVRGYGRFGIHGRGRAAHRVAWVLTYGPIPNGLDVLHHCDNPLCVNPYHLFLGTDTDNVLDSARKGRRARKLAKEDVLRIRELWATGGYTQQEIAEEFGINRAHVSNIVHRKSWAWLKNGGDA